MEIRRNPIPGNPSMKKANSPVVSEESATAPVDFEKPQKKTVRRTKPSLNGRKKTEKRRTREFVANGNHGDSALDVRLILNALITLKKGDFSVRLPMEWIGVAGKVADTFNDVADQMEHSTGDLSRISRVVGKEGKLGERLSSGEVSGGWKERVDSVNTLITDGENRQYDGESARGVCVGSDARGARSGNRRKAGRPGEGQRRGRHVEGPDG
jgi:hypothetical protein